MVGSYVGSYERRTYRPGSGELALYREQQRAAERANYRIAWSQDRGGYFGQFKSSGAAGDRWCDCYPGLARAGYTDAVLDCKLLAARAGEACRLHPLIANLTEGRREYEVDLTKPFPGRV
jgi:hypothetical protein